MEKKLKLSSEEIVESSISDKFKSRENPTDQFDQNFILKKKQEKGEDLEKKVNQMASGSYQAEHDEMKNAEFVNLPACQTFMEKFFKESDKRGIDTLTGLYNRLQLFDKGIDLIERIESGKEKEKSISVISLDIDFFKAYNEISHTFGDLALQTVGETINDFNQEKGGGFGVRLGGEEIFLLVEGGMTYDEASEHAEELKNRVKESLQKLFRSVDEHQGVSDKTVKFMEEKILTEDRNQKSFNEEMAEKPHYQKFKNELVALMENEKYLGQVPGFNLKSSPAELVFSVNQAIESVENPEVKKNLQNIKDILQIELGTVTVGMAYVEFPEEAELLPEQERQEYLDQLNKILENYPDVYNLIVVKTKDASVNDFSKSVYKLIKDISEDIVKEKAVDYIRKINFARFGTIVDQANKLEEDQKKQKRNSVSAKKFHFEQLKSREITDENIVESYEDVLDKVQTLLAQRLQTAKQKQEPLFNDNLADSFLSGLEEGGKKFRDDFYEELIILQKDKYIEPLTLAKNYNYLAQVVPEEMEKVRQEKHDYAMVSFDVDNLKAVNDTWGHKLGDVVLMNISGVMQEEMEKLLNPSEGQDDPYNGLGEKIKKTGIEPSVIRATGGEEFVATFPGLSGSESRFVFQQMNEKLKKEILKIVDQPAETASLTGSEKDKGIEGKKYQTYKEGIQEFIAGLDLTLADGETKVKRSQEEMTQFGSVTAGIVALSDLHELSDEGHIEERNYLREDGKINAGKIRQLADNIGEEAKKDIHYKTEINEKGERVLVGDSGRGTVEGVDYFMKQSSLRALEQKVKELGHENKILLSEKEKLSEELRKLRALLKNRQYEEKHEEQLQNIRGRIKEIG